MNVSDTVQSVLHCLTEISAVFFHCLSLKCSISQLRDNVIIQKWYDFSITSQYTSPRTDKWLDHFICFVHQLPPTSFYLANQKIFFFSASITLINVIRFFLFTARKINFFFRKKRKKEKISLDNPPPLFEIVYSHIHLEEIIPVETTQFSSFRDTVFFFLSRIVFLLWILWPQKELLNSQTCFSGHDYH